MDAAKGQYIHWLPEVGTSACTGRNSSDNVLQEGDLIESHYLVERQKPYDLQKDAGVSL